MSSPDRELLDNVAATEAMIRDRPLAAIAYALVAIAKDVRKIAGDVSLIRRETKRSH